MKLRSLPFVFSVLFLLVLVEVKAENGYRLWLKYDLIKDPEYLKEASRLIKNVHFTGSSEPLENAREELLIGLKGLLGKQIRTGSDLSDGFILVGTTNHISSFAFSGSQPEPARLREDGYLIKTVECEGKSGVVISADNEEGVLYGVFHFLRLLQTNSSLKALDILSNPKIDLRMINHWDNFDGTVERGYAGLSIWKWEELPEKVDQRYYDYARAMASIGINAVALNNVNASPEFLKTPTLEKVRMLADIFRSYGITVFLSANFASPELIGSLQTADPLNPEVKRWWKEKIDEIYTLIPDFGGLLVKANSEGQPGPQDYNRSHAEGANMLAHALAEHSGVLIWRAFVYEARNEDRVKDPFNEFAPLDGSFLSNVFVQVKNGPLDFQPREPFSPLFGAMPKTPQMMEFQLTQEYLGFSTHLVFLAPLQEEVLNSDTFASGKGTLVAHIIDGSAEGKSMSGMTGVANIGDTQNWTGHPFGQANWYSFGRLAWDHRLSAEEIAEEWIRMTLTNETQAVAIIEKMMLNSYPTAVNYFSPLGLNVLAAGGHHYGPQPWGRKNFHRADTLGLGFDRTSSGSKAVEQYFPEVAQIYNNIDSTPEELISWFHHVPWTYRMRSQRTFWEELCFRYHQGVDGVREMQETWEKVEEEVPSDIFQKVEELLVIQEDEAVWWRDANLWYFSKFSRRSIPKVYEQPRYKEADFKQKESEFRDLKHYSIR